MNVGTIRGHKLTVTWNGEKREERASTGTCSCGQWEESASVGRVVRDEYREHLKDVKKAKKELQRRESGL